jgi:hypothetical protein
VHEVEDQRDGVHDARRVNRDELHRHVRDRRSRSVQNSDAESSAIDGHGRPGDPHVTGHQVRLHGASENQVQQVSLEWIPRLGTACRAGDELCAHLGEIVVLVHRTASAHAQEASIERVQRSLGVSPWWGVDREWPLTVGPSR